MLTLKKTGHKVGISGTFNQPAPGVDRYAQALEYIDKHVDNELRVHLEAIVGTNQTLKNQLSYVDLSLGGRTDRPEQSEYAGNSERRRALRALLLCQRIYFSRLWARVKPNRSPYRPGEFWPAWDWASTKTETVRIWTPRTEADIQDAIRMFTVVPTSQASAVTVAASDGRNAGTAMPAVEVTRATEPFPGHGICYVAVMLWMLRAGVVSYRWMARHGFGGLDVDGLRDAFGQGTIIWRADDEFGLDDQLQVPDGQIVHLYDADDERPGHWLVSCGDGTGWGCNNNDEAVYRRLKGLSPDRVDVRYARCSLAAQFFVYKNTPPSDEAQDKKGKGKQRVRRGIAKRYDPTAIPNRL